MENDKKNKRVSRFRLICIRAFAWQPRKKKKTVKRTTKANQRKSCRDKNVNLPNQKEQKKPNNQIKSTTRRAMNRDVAVDNLSPVGRKCSFFFVLSFVLIYDRLSGSFRDFNKSLAGDWCLHLVHFVMSSLIRFLLVFTAFFLLCDSISLGFYRFDRVPLGSIRFYWIFMLVTVFSLVLLVFYIYRFDFEFY